MAQSPSGTLTDSVPAEFYRRAEQFDDDMRSNDHDEPVRAINPVSIVLRTLRGRYLIAFVLSTVLSVTGAAAGYLSKHPVYVSGGIIQVYPTRTNILYSDQDDSRLRLFDAFVAAEASFLKSPPVLERAVKSPQLRELGLSADLEGMNQLKEIVAVEKKGGLITVTTGHENPQSAATLLNVVLDAYEALHIEQLKLQDSVRDRELSLREKEILEKHADIEKQILEIGQEYGTDSIAAAHIRKIMQAEDVDKRITELSMSIAAMSNTQTNDVDVGDAELKRLVVLDHALADMLFERSKQKAELAVLEERHAPEHRDVVEMQARIKVLDQAIEERRNQLTTLGTTGALTKGSPKEKSESADDLKALQARFVTQRDALQKEARDLNGRLIKLEFLKEERTRLQETLEETRRALEQIRLESNHSLPGTIEIKSRGVVSNRPASDKRSMFCMAGGGFGAFGGFAVTLVFGFLFGSYRFSDDLREGLNKTPLLGVLPASRAASPESDQDLQNAVNRLGVDLQLLLDESPGGKILALTGAASGAGSTTVALALAQVFSNVNLRTVIVDADLVDAALSRHFNASGAAGLREGLQDGNPRSRLVDAGPANLRLLPAGIDQAVADSRTSHRQLTRILEQLRSQNDIVIVDLGPLKNRLVARLGSALADHVLLVVSAGTRPTAVKSIVSDLDALAPQRSLTIFNRATRRDPGLDSL